MKRMWYKWEGHTEKGSSVCNYHIIKPATSTNVYVNPWRLMRSHITELGSVTFFFLWKGGGNHLILIHVLLFFQSSPGDEMELFTKQKRHVMLRS
jgi:hypothetical protein